MKQVSGSAAMKGLIVILILAIFAVLYLPKYTGFDKEAQQAKTSSIAASLSAANSVNYILRKKNPGSGIAVANCTDIGNASTQKLPESYTISPATVNVGENTICKVNGPMDTSATFTATGIN